MDSRNRFPSAARLNVCASIRQSQENRSKQQHKLSMLVALGACGVLELGEKSPNDFGLEVKNALNPQ